MPVREPSIMDIALEEARAAAERGEVPVGAVIVDRRKAIVARTGNRMRELGDATAHAEVLAIRAALDTLATERLAEMDLYVTLEPCTMCAGAISLARLARLYYGAGDPKSGAVEHGVRFFHQPSCHHAPEVYGGIGETEARRLLTDFFAGRRLK